MHKSTRRRRCACLRCRVPPTCTTNFYWVSTFDSQISFSGGTGVSV